jgi:hypothetical protein
MPMLAILVLAVPACMAVAVAAGLAIVTIVVRREDRRMSLKRRPVTRAEAAARRLLGVGVRRPDDDDVPTAPAGRR